MEGSNNYIGRRLGNYRIVAEIASGSYGCIYMAQHQFLPRTVAIKFLHPHHLHSQYELDQFFAEAEFLEQLRHPCILPIYDAGIAHNNPYIITEFAPGGSLRDKLSDLSPDKVSVKEALLILSQIGVGLEFTHQRGIVHRDLKPGNILFNKNNDAMLADFGIAVLMQSATGESRASQVGTLAYMAPEQFYGRVSRYSDQYALGCIAYELFTGRPPFTASTFASLKDQHVHHAPIPPTRRNRQLPSSIEQAILTALEKDPRNRHTDIPTFISALHTKPVYQSQQVRSPRARVHQV
jgi:serine/threonine protein kinase